MRRKNRKQLKEYIAVITICVIYTFLIYILKIGCPIRFITGIPCMGCGLTRAMLAMLKLNFSSAFYYNPCIFLIPVLGFYPFCNKRIQKIIIYTFCIIFIVVYLWRLCVEHPVVKWDVENGYIYKIIAEIGERLSW